MGSDWIEQGNRLIRVGGTAPATEANFRTVQDSPVGDIEIETSSRLTDLYDETEYDPVTGQKLDQSLDVLLQDEYGALAVRSQVGDGEVIYIVPPHFAANAYQDAPGNYPFLAQLTEGSSTIWVDEYSHGFRDAEAIQQAAAQVETWASYLSQTPWSVILVQAAIMALVAVWGNNRRFGTAMSLETPQENNSAAYIRALAQVLRKASSQAFVMDTISREERLQLQKSLGLGILPVKDQTLIAAWTDKTGRPATELDPLLHPPRSRRLDESDLIAWVKSIQIRKRQT
jgi:hypothetical protein